MMPDHGPASSSDDTAARITAIETRYGGCLFRSRLEARWAVFLTRLGLDWEHEPQRMKVDTPRGSYLPDLFVPQLDIYLEVKPAHPDVIDPDGYLRWKHFAGQVAMEWQHGRTAMLTGPIPNPDTVDEYGPPRQYEWTDQPIIMLEQWHGAWCACPSGRHFDIQMQARGGRIHCGCSRVQDDRLYLTGNNPTILNAYAAARSARFERGGTA